MRLVMISLMIIMCIPLVMAGEPSPPDIVTVWGSISDNSSLDCFLLDEPSLYGEEEVTYSSMSARYEGLCFHKIDVLKEDMPEEFYISINKQNSSNISFTDNDLQRVDISLEFSDEYYFVEEEPEEDSEEEKYDDIDYDPEGDDFSEDIPEDDGSVSDDPEEEESNGDSETTSPSTPPSREPRSVQETYEDEPEMDEAEEKEEETDDSQEEDTIQIEESNEFDEFMKESTQEQEEEHEKDELGPISRAYESVRDSFGSDEPILSDKVLLLLANIVAFSVVSMMLVTLFSNKRKRKRIRRKIRRWFR